MPKKNAIELSLNNEQKIKFVMIKDKKHIFEYYWHKIQERMAEDIWDILKQIIKILLVFTIIHRSLMNL